MAQGSKVSKLRDSAAGIPGTRPGSPINGYWLLGKQNCVYTLHLKGEAWGGWRKNRLQITLFDGVSPLDLAYLPFLKKPKQKGGGCCYLWNLALLLTKFGTIQIFDSFSLNLQCIVRTHAPTRISSRKFWCHLATSLFYKIINVDPFDETFSPLTFFLSLLPTYLHATTKVGIHTYPFTNWWRTHASKGGM